MNKIVISFALILLAISSTPAKAVYGFVPDNILRDLISKDEAQNMRTGDLCEKIYRQYPYAFWKELCGKHHPPYGVKRTTSDFHMPQTEDNQYYLPVMESGHQKSSSQGSAHEEFQSRTP